MKGENKAPVRGLPFLCLGGKKTGTGCKHFCQWKKGGENTGYVIGPLTLTLFRGEGKRSLAPVLPNP